MSESNVELPIVAYSVDQLRVRTAAYTEKQRKRREAEIEEEVRRLVQEFNDKAPDRANSGYAALELTCGWTDDSYAITDRLNEIFKDRGYETSVYTRNGHRCLQVRW